MAEVLEAPILEQEEISTETEVLNEGGNQPESPNNTEETPNELVENVAENPTEKTEKKPTEAAAPELTEDEKTIAYLKSKGVSVDKIEDLIPKIEPSEEEVRQANLAKESALIQKHIAKGKDSEIFTEVKKLSQEDPINVGIQLEKKSLIERGYTPEQAEESVKQRYFQFTEEELEDMDEDDVIAAKANKEFYEKELAAKGSAIIADAKNYLSSLQGEIDSEINVQKYNAEIEAAVVEQAAKIQKVQKYELKELNEKLGLKEMTIELDETAIQDVTKDYSNKEFIENLSKKPDSEIIANLLRLEAFERSIPKMLEQAAIQGAKTQAEKLTNAMPSDPKQLFANNVSGGKANEKEGTTKHGVILGSMSGVK